MISSAAKWIRGTTVDFVYTYSSEKQVEIPRTKIAILYRLFQLAIIAYIFIYIVWIKKGYQEFHQPTGSSVIKVKGVAKVSNGTVTTGSTSQNIWDTTEYQIPPLEENALFIATRKTITVDQTVTNCPSAISSNTLCSDTNTSLCVKDQVNPNTSGYFTGRCINSSENSTIKVCEIRAWCPEESRRSLDYFIDEKELSNFTIYVKTTVSFTDFNITLRNVRYDVSNCRYGADKKDCPIFRIGDIFDVLKINVNATLRQGGLIEMRQTWTCNFDFYANQCYPTYDFVALQTGDEPISPGVNYRLADRYQNGGVSYRTLSKLYGLRFIVRITGQGGRFEIVHLFLAIGSGIGYMALATFVTECILSFIHPNRQRYNQTKSTILRLDDQADRNSETNSGTLENKPEVNGKYNYAQYEDVF